MPTLISPDPLLFDWCPRRRLADGQAREDDIALRLRMRVDSGKIHHDLPLDGMGARTDDPLTAPKEVTIRFRKGISVKCPLRRL